MLLPVGGELIDGYWLIEGEIDGIKDKDGDVDGLFLITEKDVVSL